MLISQEVYTVVSGSTIRYYENLGYEIPKYKDNQNRIAVKKGTKIKVKVIDLPKSSDVYVDVACDYCGKIYQLQYKQYINAVNKNNIHLLACYNCKNIKTQQSNLLTYGVENVMKIDKFREKQNKKHRHDVNEVRLKFIDMNFAPLFKDEDYKNRGNKLKCYCNNHPDIIQYKTYSGLLDGDGCFYCAKENNSKEGHWNWQGGITDIKNYLRNSKYMKWWKEDSLDYYQNRCYISSLKEELCVHHTISFNSILRQAFKETQVAVKSSISQYTSEELDKLEKKILQLHYYYGFGIPMIKDLHKKFHEKYGYGDNTKGQIVDFFYSYANGEIS